MPRPWLWLPIVCFLAPAVPATAGGRCSDTCDDWGDHARHCEIRELALGPIRSFVVDATPNGGIEVEGGDEPEARLIAKVQAQAPTPAEARELAAQVQVETQGSIRARGPAGRSNHWWSVSYRLRVPRQAQLDLESGNGGIHIRGVRGTIRFRTVNGGIHLEEVGGDVNGRTVNGGLQVRLEGPGWEGAGLDVQTTNGAVTLALSEGYRAHLTTSTVNGHLDVDFPVTLQGRIGKRLALELGGGGPPLRLETTNGGVKVRRAP